MHCAAVRGIETRIRWIDGGALAFTYILKADLSRLRIPPAAKPRRTDRLWQHTCFEAFVAVKDKPQYYELNFSPSGEWAVCAFARYREAAPAVKIAPAAIDARIAVDALELDSIVALPQLPMINPRARLRLALSAVIEDERGTLSYWALKHPAGKPDFHHPDSFALEIEAPRM